MDTLAPKLSFQQMNCLYQNKDDTADAYFQFDESGQVKRLSAHKIILAAGSSVFKAMFYGDPKEEGDVEIVDAASTAFGMFLQTIYQMHGNIDMENVGEVMRLADKYECNGVMQICASYLHPQVNVNNVCWVLDFALKYSFQKLEQCCAIMATLQPVGVLQSDAFAEMDHSALVHVLQLVENLLSQKIIFGSCIKWAKKSCEKQLIEATPGNLRIELGGSFSSIDFKQMSLGIFVEIQRLHPFFSFEEYVNIFEGIANAEKQRNQKEEIDDFDFSPSEFE
ncbi:BTB/POZ domain-containing protein 6-like [Sitodiplosis mosellana]|uniref:BTB/POZ domain-containing protein 6-like n=1 Tax=Sitodiplosis mosellana TaxID=263140 RepID=UPI002444DFCF|nr:BTB/POZ domain-containing protein 6-like [Sitodiplosis mosellana]